MTTDTAEYRFQQIKKVTIVGVITNVFLAVSKISMGFIGQSQALIADGVHSLADLVSDLIVIVAAKKASEKADTEHPYGHGRFETVAEVALGSLLIAVAAGIFSAALTRIYEPEGLFSPTWFALVAAAVSIFANEALFHYTIRVAKNIKSNLLKANAWHHRTDAFSSLIALVGISGSMLGYPLCDALAAIGVSFLIAKVGWDISARSLRELVDTALEPSKVEEIRKVIMSVDGVETVHSLRTRSQGANALVDVHIIVVDSRISVSEGHQISEKVLRQLFSEIDYVTDVTVHIDPEDDEIQAPCGDLPLRHEIVVVFDELFKKNKYYAQYKRIELHYLDSKLFVELILPLELISGANINVGQEVKTIIDSFVNFESLDYIAEFNVSFK